MYDVAVVGAGPAGSMAAKSAAENGATVLLIERKVDIGVPLKCGEYLPTLKEMQVLTPNVENIESVFKVPDKFIVNRTNFVKLISPRGKETEVAFEAVVIERKFFEKYLAQEAARAGADIMIRTEVQRLLPGGKGLAVIADGKKSHVKAKTIIGADGAESIIARQLGLQTTINAMDLGICFQYEMARVESDPSVVEMYFGKDYAPGAYAWIIPKGGGVANVGVGVRTPYMQKGVTAQECLRRLIKHHPVASKKLRNAIPTAVVTGMVPIGGPLPKTFTENAVVVGDAAGQTIATVGAGVPTAMICGNLAGAIAANYVRGGCRMAEYEIRWKKAVGDVLSRGLKIRKINDIIGKSDRIMEYAIGNWLKGEILEKFLRCKFDLSFSTYLAAAQRLLKGDKV
jgi:digeranylgeranylglycerophospholipid reductase